MPAFMLGGKNVAGMAAFKAHCAVMIHGEGRLGPGDGMGGYGKIATLSDLPSDAVLEVGLKEAAQRVANTGTAVKSRAKAAPKAEIAMPDDFASALAVAPAAQAVLDSFAPGQRREYLKWITTARQAATRDKRIAQSVEWLTEGKKHNWKYENC